MDVKTDLISIIVPVYNAERVLPRCLDSLLNQTYKQIESLVNSFSYDAGRSFDPQQTVRFAITDLNIRTGPGPNYTKTDQYMEIGIFMIMEVRSSQGSTAGSGHLKSGAGWTSFDYLTRV